jgi:transposase-like protein
MGTHQKLITEDLYKQAIAQLASTNKENRIAIRLRAIVAAKEHGIGMVSKIFDITTNTLRNWIKSFAQGDDNLVVCCKLLLKLLNLSWTKL